jgi:hypothetical protein
MDNQEIMLESKIIEYFTKDNGVTCHFKYIDTEDDKVELNLYTFNLKTNTNFLFHKVKSSSSITALSKMLNYMSDTMPSEKNFTVFWFYKENEDKINASYFRSEDIEQVMIKFYTGKNRDEIEVSEIKLNPLS